MLKTGVAYHDVRNVRHAREDLEDMVAHHCNFVVHTFSETDLAYYLRAMKEIVSISKDLGLEVYIDPWGVGGIFGGEALSSFVGRHLKDRQILADDRSVPAACMNSEEFRSFMRIWIEAAAETGAGIAFWDEPHFYSGEWVGGENSWACRCAACQKKFGEKYGRSMPRQMNHEVIEFREQTVVDFFTHLCDHSRTCGMKNALCVLPEKDSSHGVSDWEKLAAIPALDIFGTDPYWGIFGKPLESYCREKTREARQLCEKYGRELQMWVQAFLIQEDKEDEVIQAAEFLYEEGARNIAAWSYGGGGWMIVRSENADKVWENIGQAFGKLHRLEARQ